MEEIKMSDMNSVVNNILKGADIRKALSSSETFNVICEAESADNNDFKQAVKNNPINKKIKQIADKYGYVAKETFLTSYGGIQCSIYPKAHNDYHPDVYIDKYYDVDDSGKIDFRIQTTSYGSISVSDYSEFLKACEDAYNMLSEIKKLDLSKLTKAPKNTDY